MIIMHKSSQITRVAMCGRVSELFKGGSLLLRSAFYTFRISTQTRFPITYLANKLLKETLILSKMNSKTFK